MATSEKLFLEDAYLEEIDAKVIYVNDRGGIVLDRTNFYATSGGQPGDIGNLITSAGSKIDIATTVCGETKDDIILVPATAENLPKIGDSVKLHLNWERRHKLMRMHSALHLLCALVPFPVTGGQIGEDGSRLDFDMPESPDKEKLSEEINTLINQDHPISHRWVSDSDLDANPDLVRTMSVQPPRGSGKMRLVGIGAHEEIDLQPCGGTHVRSTKEIGLIEVFKTEKKGNQNRRVRIRFTQG